MMCTMCVTGVEDTSPDRIQHAISLNAKHHSVRSRTDNISEPYRKASTEKYFAVRKDFPDEMASGKNAFG